MSRQNIPAIVIAIRSKIRKTSHMALSDLPEQGRTPGMISAEYRTSSFCTIRARERLHRKGVWRRRYPSRLRARLTPACLIYNHTKQEIQAGQER